LNSAYFGAGLISLAHTLWGVLTSLGPKGEDVMSTHSSLAPALWGMAGGAATLAIIGFLSGSWVTQGSAERDAENRAASAVVAVLAPICLTRFQQASDASIKLEEVKRTFSYARPAFVEKAGWATMPGRPVPRPGVARACAGLIESLK
jgi:hypothetical protein